MAYGSLITTEVRTYLGYCTVRASCGTSAAAISQLSSVHLSDLREMPCVVLQAGADSNNPRLSRHTYVRAVDFSYFGNDMRSGQLSNQCLQLLTQ